ncbi:MAG: DUF192 domain-containing protein [Bdellovibrionales bacterium]|nr:DUF192 domain-containing protein [Bdellovibrionales bacterium]
MAELKNMTKQKTVMSNVLIAKTFKDRSKGLLGHQSLDTNTAMWIHNCAWIHTFFMRFAIDAVFVDRHLKVTTIKPHIPPDRLTWPALGASSVFEMAAGMAQANNIQVGDQLHVGN